MVTGVQLNQIKAETAVGQYFDIEEDGIRLLDVLDQTPLRPGAFPQAVYDTPRLSEGIDFLRYLGHRITVPVMLAPHASAEDFTTMTQTFPVEYSTCAAMGLEMYWRNSQQSPNARPHPREITLAPAQAGGFMDFQQAQLRWASDCDVRVLPLELAEDDTSDLAVKQRTLWELYLQTKNDEALTPPLRQVAAVIAERAYQATRQPAIVAQLGAWALALNNSGELPTELPIMLGSWHGMSVQRLKNLGVDAKAHASPRYEKSSEAYRAYGQMMMRAMYDGFIPLQLLHAPRPQP